MPFFMTIFQLATQRLQLQQGMYPIDLLRRFEMFRNENGVTRIAGKPPQQGAVRLLQFIRAIALIPTICPSLVLALHDTAWRHAEILQICTAGLK
jgi:hypothetical protein